MLDWAVLNWRARWVGLELIQAFKAWTKLWFARRGLKPNCCEVSDSLVLRLECIYFQKLFCSLLMYLTSNFQNVLKCAAFTDLSWGSYSTDSHTCLLGYLLKEGTCCRYLVIWSINNWIFRALPLSVIWLFQNNVIITNIVESLQYDKKVEIRTGQSLDVKKCSNNYAMIGTYPIDATWTSFFFNQIHASFYYTVADLIIFIISIFKLKKTMV